MQLAENSTSSCADFLDTLAGVAFRFCGGNYVGGALWSDTFDANLCAAVTSNITSQLCKAATVSLLGNCMSAGIDVARSL